jgi:hypothetical protein
VTQGVMPGAIPDTDEDQPPVLSIALEDFFS